MGREFGLGSEVGVEVVVEVVVEVAVGWLPKTRQTRSDRCDIVQRMYTVHLVARAFGSRHPPNHLLK